MTDAPTSPFVIVGAGGHGRELLDLVLALGWQDRFVGFVDDGPDEITHQRIARRGSCVVGDVEWLADQDLDHVLGIGTSPARRSIQERLGGRPGLAVVHPTASVGSEADLAEGTVVCGRATITTNVSLGRHTHLNVGSTVQHDTIVGDYVTVSPGVVINGDVTIGSDVFIGSGAIITRGCTIGDGCTIGAGAVVLHDLPARTRAHGVPARPLD